MSKAEEFVGGSLETLLDDVAVRLGVGRQEIRYQIVSEQRGFLGVPVRSVAIRVETPEPRLESVRRPTRRRGGRGPSVDRQRQAGLAVATLEVEAGDKTPPLREGTDAGDDVEVPTRAERDTQAEEDLGPDESAPAVLEMLRAMVEAMGLELDVALVEEPARLVVNLSGADREIVLDHRGETLDAMQYIASRMARRQLGTRKRVQLESEGFRSIREDEIRQMAVDAAEKVQRTGAPVRLPLLNPYERRIVHVTLSGCDGVSTESEGDGFVKRVTVRHEPSAGVRPRTSRKRDVPR